MATSKNKTGYLRLRSCVIEDLPLVFNGQYPIALRSKRKEGTSFSPVQTPLWRCVPLENMRACESSYPPVAARMLPGYVVAVVVSSSSPNDCVYVLESDTQLASRVDYPCDPLDPGCPVFYCPRWLDMDRVLLIVTDSSPAGIAVEWENGDVRKQFQSIVRSLKGLNHIVTVDKDDPSLCAPVVASASTHMNHSAGKKSCVGNSAHVSGIRATLVAWAVSNAYRPSSLVVDRDAYLHAGSSMDANKLRQNAQTCVDLLARQQFVQYTLLVTCMTTNAQRGFYWAQRVCHLVHRLGVLFMPQPELHNVQLRFPRVASNANVKKYAIEFAHAPPVSFVPGHVVSHHSEATLRPVSSSFPWATVVVLHAYSSVGCQTKARMCRDAHCGDEDAWDARVHPVVLPSTRVDVRHLHMHAEPLVLKAFPTYALDAWGLYRTLTYLATKRRDTHTLLPQVDWVLPEYVTIHPKWWASVESVLAMRTWLACVLRCRLHSHRARPWVVPQVDHLKKFNQAWGLPPSCDTHAETTVASPPCLRESVLLDETTRATQPTLDVQQVVPERYLANVESMYAGGAWALLRFKCGISPVQARSLPWDTFFEKDHLRLIRVPSPATGNGVFRVDEEDRDCAVVSATAYNAGNVSTGISQPQTPLKIPWRVALTTAVQSACNERVPVSGGNDTSAIRKRKRDRAEACLPDATCHCSFLLAGAEYKRRKDSVVLTDNNGGTYLTKNTGKIVVENAISKILREFDLSSTVDA
jgi:hypothetical protein